MRHPCRHLGHENSPQHICHGKTKLKMWLFTFVTGTFSLYLSFISLWWNCISLGWQTQWEGCSRHFFLSNYYFLVAFSNWYQDPDCVLNMVPQGPNSQTLSYSLDTAQIYNVMHEISGGWGVLSACAVFISWWKSFSV